MNIKVIVLNLVLVLIPSIIFASNPGKTPGQESDTVEIVAQGVGVDADSALRNAYSNAIQQALGLYVDASTLVENEQIIKDQILTHSRGVIQEVKTVSERKENGLINITILAKILKEPLAEKVKPIISASSAIDGRSIHSGIATKKKQTIDAQALLEEVLKPFLSTELYTVEFDGEPKFDESNNGKLLIPLKIHPNTDLYIAEMQRLIGVLDQIATEKHDFNAKMIDKKINYSSLVYVPQNEQVIPKWGRNQQSQEVLVNTWVSPDLRQSKWTAYLLSASCKSPQVIATVEVSLMDESGTVLSIEEASLDERITSFSPYVPLHGTYGYCFFSPFLVRKRQPQDFVPEIRFEMPVSIDAGLLSQVSQMKLEVKYRTSNR